MPGCSEIEAAGAQAAAQFQESGKAARMLTEFDYRTRKSLSAAQSCTLQLAVHLAEQLRVR
jgi:hypothetical protein